MTKDGCIATLKVRRADGSEEHPFGPLHNVFMNTVASNSARQTLGGAAVARLYSERLKVPLGGTWKQTGTTVSRETGADSMPTSSGAMILFSDGRRAYRINTSGTTSFQVGVAQEVIPQSASVLRVDQNLTTSDLLWSLSAGTWAALSWSGSALTATLAGDVVMPVATVQTTVRRMSISYATVSATTGSSFDFPSDVVLNPGDCIILTGFSVTETFSHSAPITYAAGKSPISGLRGSGKYQRLLRASLTDAAIPNRIWLIAAANKLTLGDLNDTAVAAASVTAIQTLTTFLQSTATSALPTNHMFASGLVHGRTTGAAANVAQIAFGNATTVYGVIEPDSPISLAADRSICIEAGTVMEVGVQAPAAPVNTVAPAVTKPGSDYVTTAGTWTIAGEAYTLYQWFKNGVAHAGQATSTYTDTASLVNGDQIYCRVTKANLGGIVSANSNTVTVSIGSAPVNTVAPALLYDTIVVGEVVETDDGTWTNTPTGYTYQWQLDGDDVPGDTTPNHVLEASDDGKSLRCQVVASNAFGDSAPENSDALVIEFEPIPSDDNPTIAYDPDTNNYSLPVIPTWQFANGGISYNWMVNGVVQTGGDYAVFGGGGVDPGQSVQLEIVATNVTKEFYAYSTTITHTPPPPPDLPENTVAPVIGWTGTNEYEGDIEVLDNGTWTSSPTGFAYQWNKNGADVVGQTTPTWSGSLANGDDLLCKVTAFNEDGSSDPANSNTIADYIVPGVVTVYADDTADNNDLIVVQWNTANDGTFPNELLFPQDGGGYFIGTVTCELRLPGPGTYYVRMLNRNEAGDSSPTSMLTVTAI